MTQAPRTEPTDEKDALRDTLLRRAARMRSIRVRKEILRAYEVDDIDLLRVYNNVLHTAQDLNKIRENVSIVRGHIGPDAAPFITTIGMEARLRLDSLIITHQRGLAKHTPMNARNAITCLVLQYPEHVDVIRKIITERNVVDADGIREILAIMEESNPMLREGTL